jgi:hypothetical protein
MIKKLIIIFLTVFAFILMFSGCTSVQPAEENPDNTQQNDTNNEQNGSNTQKNDIERTLSNWFNAQFAGIYNIDGVNFYFEREETENGKEIYFILATMTHTLKLQNADEHPVVEAISEFMDIESGNISQMARTYLENFLKDYKNNLEDYIRNKQVLNVRFKVVFSGEDYQIYIEDPHQNYKNIDSYYQAVTPEELKDSVLKSLNMELLNYENGYRTLYGQREINSIYNAQKAVEYANSYTSNTSKINSQCGDNPIVYQDRAFYNPAYSAYACDDCANHVSQAIHAGGIPYDSLWYPGVPTWACVDGCGENPQDDDLFSYMLSHYCFLSRSGIYAIPGSAALFDWNHNGSPDHATMVVYNDGYTLTFSAHTGDKKEYLLPINYDVYYLIFY